jgi:hypothetical protein
MANTAAKPPHRVPLESIKLPPQLPFVPWGERFFEYLVREKSDANPGLMELVYHLNDDGRQELALSILDFLRVNIWKDFCAERRVTKHDAKKRISKAISDLRKARRSYCTLLTAIPEFSLARATGESQRLHLSDILEKEATFLSSQARLARAVVKSTHPPRVARGARDRIEEGTSVALLSKASVKLTHAAKTYRTLLTLTSLTSYGKAFDAVTPSQLLAILGSEEAALHVVLDNVNGAFNKKRFGTSADWALLIRLQDFIKAFGLRWGSYLPLHTTLTLGESDLADLLEAGWAALGLLEDWPFMDAESIGRALERFRRHPRNQRICNSLRNSAQTICDGLRIRPPNPQILLGQPEISTFLIFVSC